MLVSFHEVGERSLYLTFMYSFSFSGTVPLSGTVSTINSLSQQNKNSRKEEFLSKNN